MFAGEHICKLDEKGRFVLPPPMREILESQGKRLVYLKGLRNLEILMLENTRVTNAGVAELQKSLPTCEISHSNL